MRYILKIILIYFFLISLSFSETNFQQKKFYYENLVKNWTKIFPDGNRNAAGPRFFKYLIDQNDQLIVDKLNWKGEAKKSGIQMGDIISNFKIENPERPNKAIVYPFALIILFVFGFINSRNKSLRAS